MKRLWALLIATLFVCLMLVGCDSILDIVDKESQDDTDNIVNELPDGEQEEENPTEDTGEHVHSYTATVVDPTCTTGGRITQTCECGDSYVSDVIPPTGHQYNTITVEPTDTSAGYVINICACGDAYYSEYNDVHIHQYIQNIVAPSCTMAGYTTFNCSCGDSYFGDIIPARGHNYVDIYTKESSCTEQGYTTYVCDCGFSYTDDYKGGSHSYDVELLQPTATTDGYSKHTCSVCGDTYTEYLIPESFTVTKENRHLIGYTGVENEVLNIPAIFENNGKWYKVTEIGDDAFSVWNNQYNLAGVTIPDTVTTIGSYAFGWCINLEYITIPDSVTSIRSYAFNYCTKLTSIIIPDCVTTIEGGTFYNCASLISITIPDKVTTIGYCAFGWCFNLEDITIPASVIDLGENLFYDCCSLENITVHPDNPCYKSVDGNLYTKDGKTLIQYAIGKKDNSFTIPDGVTSIANYAFNFSWVRENSSLISIVIPESVTSIDSGAFSSHVNLYVIYNNSDIAISFGSGVAQYAKIIVDKGTLRSVSDGKQYILTEDNFLFEYNGSVYTLIAYLGNEETVTLPDYINGSSYEIREMRGVKNVIIPDTVTSINAKAFYKCYTLTGIVIGNNVTSIGNYAFYRCDSLTSIVIPDSVTSIDSYAFGSCYNLTIYCEAQEKPAGWDEAWNPNERPVEWGYTAD